MGRQPGHRQRGAGSVTVSKGEVERQGVLVKEWQRTPMQLLHEYCQSKKRRNAFYPSAKAPEGKFRVRCVLPDDKNSAKDLKFCPEQSFDTLDEAKHCAALLALQYVEPLRPLERKLPDPYRDLWLSMTTPAAASTAGKPTTGSAAAANGRKPKASSKKSDPVAASPPPPPAAAAALAASKAETDMDFWANAPDSPKKSEAKTKKFPMELTADRKFASHAEFEKAKLEQVQARNKKARQRENRERANLHKEVFMSAACREMIEQVLRRLGTITTSAVSDEPTGSDDSPNGKSSSHEVARAHDAFYESVSRQLRVIGFQQTHIQGALQACKKESEHSDDEYMTIILDWLCLNVPEGDLPKGFNPEGTQLDVVLSAKDSSSNAPSEQAVVMSPVLVQRLMKYGYDRRDAVSVANEYLRTHPEDAGNESPSAEIVFALLKQLHPYQMKHFDVDIDTVVDGVPDAEELASMRQDEIFALEAIYEDRFEAQTLAAIDDQSQLLQLQVSDDVQLEIFLPSSSKYPFELPIIGLTSSNPAFQPYLLFTCGNVMKSCMSTLGDPMIYDICVAVDTILGECVSNAKAPRIVLLPHANSNQSTSKKHAEGTRCVPPPPAPAAATTNASKNGKKTQAKKNQKATKRFPEKKVDLEAMQRMSAKLSQLRQNKDNKPEFQQMAASRAKLPAAAEKANVIHYLKHNQVVLVCGQTGCGKTTQIPQFILDDYIDSNKGGECQIICTQPRRIAAIGVATRVAQERCEDIADIVGYQIRMDAKKSANTRLLFCTTGVLLRRLLSDRSLSGVSHVIVDEVHERNIDTDFLLSILRDLLPKRPDLRLILMSATMNSSLFVNYFSSISKSPCPVLDIPGFTYPVKCNFLEDVLATTSYEVPKKLLLEKKKKKTQSDDGDTTADKEKSKRIQELSPQELVEIIDDARIDYDLVAHLVTHLVEKGKTDNGSILIFLPGTAEIKRLMEMLMQTSHLASKLLVLPLHGSLSGADQSLVFRPAPKGKTKIIVSTNIAETSITINDITVVIDCGKVKEMVYDTRQRRSQLLDCWAAQAACEQRKGRAGRVQAGTCYRLFSRKRFDGMEAQLSAEIHRVSLEQLCLQIKKLELGSIKAFLAKAIEPPKEEAIDAAMQELVEIAAFKQVSIATGRQRGGTRSTAAANDEDEVVLTPLGNHLAMLPLDARIGKFLVYGSILRCIEPVVIIAACISSKNPFLLSMSDPELKGKQDGIKKELHGNWKSDHLLLWKVLERYSPLKGQKLKRGFCKDFGLSFDTMESIMDLKNQYLQQLGDIGFYDACNAEHLNLNASVPRIVKAALCAGLYGNVAQVVYPEQKYFQSAHGVFTEEHDAKKIRYFVRSTDPQVKNQRERVFLHPSSCNFVQTQYDSPWLLYTELVQTSKVFVRESTMVNPYALLLFGGKLEVVHEKNLLVLDQWIHFQAVARIGVLIKAIRKHLDQLLMAKIETPELDIAQSDLVSAISHLLKSEGM